MQFVRLVSIFIIFSFISFSLFSNYSHGENETENVVDTNITIEFVSGTELSVDTIMDVHKITTDRTYSSEQIRSASQQEIGAFRHKLYTLLKNQFQTMFLDANLLNFSMPVFNGNLFREKCTVKLTSLHFDMNESINAGNFINGLLDMGAIINYSFTLEPDIGWNVTYIFVLPPNLQFTRTTGLVDGNKIQYEVINGNGLGFSKIAEISLSLSQPTTSGLVKEDVNVKFILDTQRGKTTSLTANISANAVDIRSYDILPKFVTNLKIVPADGIRMFIDSSILTWDEFNNLSLRKIEEDLLSAMENSSFNQTLNPVIYWDKNTTIDCKNPFEVRQMDDKPPITIILFDDDVQLQICGISSRGFLGLISSGGVSNISAKELNFGHDFAGIDIPFSNTILLPQSIFINGQNPFSWNESDALFGRCSSKNPPVYQDEHIETTIVLDAESSDLNLLSFFTGGAELNLGLSIHESQDNFVIKLPHQFNLPQKLSLEYLNADALRLCIQEEVFLEDDINTFINDTRNNFETRIENLFQIPKGHGFTDQEKFLESLVWDDDIAHMDADSPVNIVNYAHVSHTIPLDFSILPPQITISNQTFYFTGLTNQRVTYQFYFPPGTKVEAYDTLNKVFVAASTDGREYIEITFESFEGGVVDEVTIRVVPSLFFIIGLFTPCLVSLFITIILVGVIYIIRRRKRKKGGPAPIDQTGYEGRDYYIPPSPGGK